MQTIWQMFVKIISIGIGLAVVLGIGLLLAREYFLWQGTGKIKADLRVLRRLSGTSTCAKEFGALMTAGEQEYRQLRFTSDTEYVLEVVCPSFLDKPLAQQQRTLPRFMSRVPGSAGVIERTGVPESLIGVMIFEDLVATVPEQLRPWFGWVTKSELIGLQNDEIVILPLRKEATSTTTELFGTGPISTCEGYGFTCCDAQTQLGMGDAVKDLQSCPANCFATCASRPLVISWKSNPTPDWETKVVSLPSGGALEFFYALDDGASSGPWVAAIDFGDGQQTTINGKSGAVEHRYTCVTDSCEYNARIAVENAVGVRSSETPLSTIKIIVGTGGSVSSPYSDGF